MIWAWRRWESCVFKGSVFTAIVKVGQTEREGTSSGKKGIIGFASIQATSEFNTPASVGVTTASDNIPSAGKGRALSSEKPAWDDVTGSPWTSGSRVSGSGIEGDSREIPKEKTGV